MIFGGTKLPILLLLIVLFTLVTFMMGLRIPFVAEDFYVLANANTPFSQAWQTMLDSSRIWPLGTVYRWLLFQLFGLNPGGYHLFSLLVHLGNIVLVYLIAKHLTKKPSDGLLAALIFAVYPRHHQPVLWMAASQVLVFTFFGLISLYAFLKYSEAGRPGWLLVVVAALALAVLTLEGAIVLLPLLFFMDTLLPAEPLLRRFRSAKFYLKYVPVLVILIGFVWINFGGVRAFKLNVQETSKTELTELGIRGDSYHVNKPGLKTFQETATYITYATYPQIPLRALDPNLLTVLLAGATCIGLSLIFLKGNRLIRLAILWLGVSLLPYVFFAPFGNADRYFYFASIGFALLVASLLRQLYTQVAQSRVLPARPVAAAVIGLYALSSFALIQQRISEWQAAGEIAASLGDRVMDMYPDPAPGDTILFAGVLPVGYGQAYIYNGGGIGPQLTLHYGDRVEQVRIFQTTDQAVRDYLTDAPEVAAPVPQMHVFLYENDTLADRSNTIDRINVLNPDTWFD